MDQNEVSLNKRGAIGCIVIHFAYALPLLKTGTFTKLLSRYSHFGHGSTEFPHWYRYGWFPETPTPLPAPGSITMRLASYLRRRHPIRFYSLEETGDIDWESNDIILGHPHPDPSTIIQRAFSSSAPCKHKALIFPIHHAIPEINSFALPLLEQADQVFGIMGPYWNDTLDQSCFAPWKHKITSLDMAVDGDEYPYLKKRFNPPGRRGYFYIGSSSDRPEKGCDILEKTMAKLSRFPSGWIGGGRELSSMKRIATYASLTPSFMAALANQFDFFINTSISDANPTTILEAMAWGFPVACTPGSGYHKIPAITMLSSTPTSYSSFNLLQRSACRGSVKKDDD
jgi:glycosyltransferase involved in cell wall biosynthesis